jgi:hypothetical protein
MCQLARGVVGASGRKSRGGVSGTSRYREYRLFFPSEFMSITINPLRRSPKNNRRSGDSVGLVGKEKEMKRIADHLSVTAIW